MTRAIVTLTTDFGPSSPYVAQMKGVILSINPRATVVDLCHSIPPQDIRQGALLLPELTRYFPPNTIHVAVVDPGVGTARRLVYARFGTRQIVCPDNGLLTGLAREEPTFTMVELIRPEYWLPEPTRTFHGRDIMAPVAAWLSLGLSPVALGPECTQPVEIPWPEASRVANRIEGEIVSVDSFGNLITSITETMLAGVPRGEEEVKIHCDGHETQGIFQTYADQPPMTLIALVGSSGRLELAIVNDSARDMLGVRAGEKVVVTW